MVWIAEPGDIERVVALVQSIERQGLRELPRLVLVTRATQGAGTGPRRAEGAELWGLAQASRHELAALQILCVDLSAASDESELEALAREIACCTPETHVAL